MLNEKQLIEQISSMCAQSLSPSKFNHWEDIKQQLEKTRSKLKEMAKDKVEE